MLQVDDECERVGRENPRLLVRSGTEDFDAFHGDVVVRRPPVAGVALQRPGGPNPCQAESGRTSPINGVARRRLSFGDCRFTLRAKHCSSRQSLRSAKYVSPMPCSL
jgi:hypothetical protein